MPASPLSDTQYTSQPLLQVEKRKKGEREEEDDLVLLLPDKKKLNMASDGSDEDIFDYDDDYEEPSDLEFDDGDSSINDGTSYYFCGTRVTNNRY